MICVGNGICPIRIPKIAVTIIPMKIEPGTCIAIKMTVRIKPNRVIQTAGELNLPKVTRVESLFTINLPFCRPIKAINKPIPAEIAYFKSCGIASTTFSRNLKTVIKINKIEATKTAAKAVCHLICMPTQTL